MEVRQGPFLSFDRVACAIEQKSLSTISSRMDLADSRSIRTLIYIYIYINIYVHVLYMAFPVSNTSVL